MGMPPTCPDTGARELSNMEKNCEMFNYMFLAVMFLFVGLLTDAKYTAAMFCAAVSGFLIGGAGFIYRLRKRYPEAYTRWFTNSVSRSAPELFVVIYVLMIALLSGFLFGVADIQ